MQTAAIKYTLAGIKEKLCNQSQHTHVHHSLQFCIQSYLADMHTVCKADDRQSELIQKIHWQEV